MTESGLVATTLAGLLTRHHRHLDDLFGRFLAATQVGDAQVARSAIVDFDETLRRHMHFEEEHLLPEAGGHKLAPAAGEAEDARLARELRLEHVQVRELSGMIRRVLEEEGNLDAARRLAPNLARRWDAHTTREEKSLEGLESHLDPERRSRLAADARSLLESRSF